MASRRLDAQLNRDIKQATSSPDYCLDCKDEECATSASIVAEHEEKADYVDDAAACDKGAVASGVFDKEGYGNSRDCGSKGESLGYASSGNDRLILHHLQVGVEVRLDGGVECH